MTSQAPPQKEAVVLLFDVNPGMRSQFAVAKAVASSLVQQKLVFSPRDEIGIVLAGSDGTMNRLNTALPSKYHNITVARPIVSPVADFLALLDSTAVQSSTADMFEALVVAADLIHERTADRKYNRRIVFITNADSTVRRKDDLTVIVDSLKSRNVSLVVIGIDFDEVVDEDEDWSGLTSKQENERVLRFMCEQLSESSIVIPVRDAVAALAALRKRNIPQRTLSRCILGIGDVKIPVFIYTKALLQAFPSLHRTTEKGDFVTEKRYFSVRRPDVEIDASQRVKAYRYGKSVIPFNEVDLAQMKFNATRSMEALGFVATESIPIHLLMGGVKAIAPPPGDTNAAHALSAFVHGMEICRRVMIVRYVWRENSDPVLGACFPSPKATRNILYFAPLPFAEDLRHYSFPSHAHVKLTSQEERAIEEVVHAMTIDDTTLAPKTVFNPALQQYYTSLRARYLDPKAPIPPLAAELRHSACAWGEPGNILEPVLTRAKKALQATATLFPPAAPKEGGAGKQGKVFWFAKAQAGAVRGRDEPDDAADAPPRKAARADNYFGTASTATTQAPNSSQSSLRDATAVTQVTPQGVTTVDPVGTFKALLSAKGVDNVPRAIFEMTDVIFRLLRQSIGEQYYGRAGECIRVLRQGCLDEGEPNSFNKFLLNLMLTVRGESHDAFWDKVVVAGKILPITKSECDESDLDDAGALTFLSEHRGAPKEIVDEEAEEDLFGQLE